jgi:hypothetical protein
MYGIFWQRRLEDRVALPISRAAAPLRLEMRHVADVEARREDTDGGVWRTPQG